jgi:hypothetical protein
MDFRYRAQNSIEAIKTCDVAVGCFKQYWWKNTYCGYGRNGEQYAPWNCNS